MGQQAAFQQLDPVRLFHDYLVVTGVAHIEPESDGDPRLIGKRLGLVNGAAWITLWAQYFGRQFCPGAHLVMAGNEAVQMNFMTAHQQGHPTPPQANIDVFVRYAEDLVSLANVDAILITCSTMNRAYPAVQAAVNVPVVPIDRPMMERAIDHGGQVLVIATHGPTVASTQKLLAETAEAKGKPYTFCGVTVEEAWHRLAVGDIEGHNNLIANAIRETQRAETLGSVVLAQLSMTVFLFTYPDPEAEFGIPVFTSGQCGFEYMRELLAAQEAG